jgi:hypothetical protein
MNVDRLVTQRAGFSSSILLTEPPISIPFPVYTPFRRAPSPKESYGQPLGHLSFLKWDANKLRKYTLSKRKVSLVYTWLTWSRNG